MAGFDPDAYLAGQTPAQRVTGYDTDLGPVDEVRFQGWTKAQSKRLGRSLDGETEDYDLRGLYRDTHGADLQAGHFTDKFKKPNHPTFSSESAYSKPGLEGGTWVKQDDGTWEFRASLHNVANLGRKGLEKYFAEREPGNHLVLPQGVSAAREQGASSFPLAAQTSSQPSGAFDPDAYLGIRPRASGIEPPGQPVGAVPPPSEPLPSSMLAFAQEMDAKTPTLRTLMPGLRSTFDSSSPERADEVARFDRMKNAPNMVALAEEVDQTPMAALMFAPMGTPTTAAPSPLALRFKDKAVEAGRKALTGNRGAISVKKPLSEESVLESLRNGAIKPLSNVQAIDTRLQGARAELGQQYADLISQLEARGITGPDATALAVKLLNEAKTVSANSLGSPTPGLLESTAEELATKPTNAAGRLGLSQAENMKRTLQDEAATEYDKLLGKMRPAGKAKMLVASRMREAIEDEVKAQAAMAPDQAAAFEPLKQRLSNTIEASKAAQEAAARAGRNQGLSLSDTMAAATGGAAGGFAGAAGLAGLNKMIRTRGPATSARLNYWLYKKLAEPRAPETFMGVPGEALASDPVVQEMIRAMTRARLRAPVGSADEGEDRK